MREIERESPTYFVLLFSLCLREDVHGR
jgi:hypothetical protein